MCLAVPGKIVGISRDPDDEVTGMIGTVDFQGSRLDVSLAMTPEVTVGNWVLVHAGFALTVLDEQAARETWQYIESADLGQMPKELRDLSAGAAEQD